MNMDAHLDPEGETLPVKQFVDLRAAPVRCSTCLREQVEQWTEESAHMSQDLPDDPEPSLVDDVHVIETGMDRKSLCIIVENDIDLLGLFRKAYHTDTVCSKILAHPGAHPCF
jgi:hypothetical protein